MRGHFCFKAEIHAKNARRYFNVIEEDELCDQSDEPSPVVFGFLAI